MKLPKGTLQKLSSITGISTPRLCDYAATRLRPGRKRALVLESKCKEAGIDIPAIMWLYGASDEIKERLTNGNGNGAKGNANDRPCQ